MNNSEIIAIINQLEDTWNGEPWYGKPVLQLLKDIPEDEAYTQPQGQHSLADLVWHMVTWRRFVLSRIQPSGNQDLHYFEGNDWRKVATGSTCNWQSGLAQLHSTQEELITALGQLDNSILERQVPQRTYNFRKLLYGIIQHDIYHLGQIAYIQKMLRAAAGA